jgi:histidinol dehydrogenase
LVGGCRRVLPVVQLGVCEKDAPELPLSCIGEFRSEPLKDSPSAMSRLLDASAFDFPAAWRALLADRSEAVDGAEAEAARILDEVRAGGWDAVVRLTHRLDGVQLSQESAVVRPGQMAAARAACPPEVLDALELAAARIRAFHDASRPADHSYTDAQGLTLGWRWTPVESAGLYVPGGRAAYPSSVLMNAIPAKAAGVERLVMVTPPGRLADNPAILAAASIAGVDEVYALGGAQAIGALAYGAGPVRPVDVIVGPGNAWVSAAKKLVFGTVGIDSVAGPSEVYVVADAGNDPRLIAADLLAQAEHDTVAQSILFTDDAAFGQAVIAAAEALMQEGQAGPAARTSWQAHGAVIVVASLADACPLIDEGAPEHLQIATEDPGPLASLVRHAGAIFLGRWTPEALGDYVAGPNHVLPTGMRARWASGLTTHMFMKRTTLLGTGPDGLRAIGPAAVALAVNEGLPAHAASVRLRLEALGIGGA